MNIIQWSSLSAVPLDVLLVWSGTVPYSCQLNALVLATSTGSRKNTNDDIFNLYDLSLFIIIQNLLDTIYLIWKDLVSRKYLLSIIFLNTALLSLTS